MSNQHTEFADFFQASWEPCLRALVAVVGSPALAEDQVAEAFANAGRKASTGARSNCAAVHCCRTRSPRAERSHLSRTLISVTLI